LLKIISQSVLSGWLSQLIISLITALISLALVAEYTLLLSAIWPSGILLVQVAILYLRLSSVLPSSQNTKPNFWWCLLVNSTVSCVLPILLSL
ncbi:hypothetical protein V2W45_1251740, partial [Cenococcum geophilum]